MPRLDNIDLSNNNLTYINADLFIGTKNLSVISLAYNPLHLDAEQTFLNLPTLKQLNLQGCNLSNVYSTTFRNLTELTELNLHNNSFGDNPNIEAFQPLKILHKLKFPTIPESRVIDLCRSLGEIDVINFDSFNISCFLFLSESTFEESKIILAPPTTIRIEGRFYVYKHYSWYDNICFSYLIEILTTTVRTSKTTPTASPKILLPVVASSIKSVEANATLKTKNNASLYDTLNTPITTEISNKVHVSSNTLRHILIASIVVAIVGLAIGLCCRRDIFGVKSKLCRTSHRRPRNTDQVRPAEQTPLKDIELAEIKRKEDC